MLWSESCAHPNEKLELPIAVAMVRQSSSKEKVAHMRHETGDSRLEHRAQRRAQDGHHARALDRIYGRGENGLVSRMIRAEFRLHKS